MKQLQQYTNTSKRCKYLSQQINRLLLAETNEEADRIYTTTATNFKWSHNSTQLTFNLKPAPHTITQPIQTTLFTL